MNLRDYWRPEGDNGLGIHIAPTGSHGEGLEFWLDRVVEMLLSVVVFFAALPVAKVLFAHDRAAFWAIHGGNHLRKKGFFAPGAGKYLGANRVQWTVASSAQGYQVIHCMRVLPILSVDVMNVKLAGCPAKPALMGIAVKHRFSETAKALGVSILFNSDECPFPMLQVVPMSPCRLTVGAVIGFLGSRIKVLAANLAGKLICLVAPAGATVRGRAIVLDRLATRFTLNECRHPILASRKNVVHNYYYSRNGERMQVSYA